MPCEGDEEAFEYFQAFPGVQEEQAKLECEDEKHEDSADGDAEGEADDEQTEDNDIISFR